jgi:hypothetical protein
MKEMLDSKRTLQPTKNEKQLPHFCLVLIARRITNIVAT